MHNKTCNCTLIKSIKIYTTTNQPSKIILLLYTCIMYVYRLCNFICMIHIHTGLETW